MCVCLFTSKWKKAKICLHLRVRECVWGGREGNRNGETYRKREGVRGKERGGEG